MASETIEPTPGTPHPDEAPKDVTGADTSETTTPAPPLVPPAPRTGSTDDLVLALAAKPDPLLGAFDPEAPPSPPVAEASLGPELPRSSAELEALGIEKPLPLQPLQPPGSFEAFGSILPEAPPQPAEAVSEPPPAEVSAGAAAEPPSSGSFDDLAAVTMTPEPPAPLADAELPPPAVEEPAEAFGGIDLSAPPSAAPPKKTEPEEDDEDEYDDEPEGHSLAFVLLLSYASAVTLGLIYVLWTGRTLKRSEEPDFLPPVDERVDPGQRAKFSRKLAPPPPIKAEHMTTLGKPVTMGALEVTPLEITSGPILLRHLIGSNERRQEGTEALKLHLKLRNVSKDLVFAPLDEAFLREREAGVTDSYIELPEGGNIEMHPLAVSSEWGIVGQEFKELKPGESLETWVVSIQDALKRMTPEMTWRVRLRTGIDQSDFLGVRFKDADVKPGR